MPDCFVSYSRRDVPFVTRLVEALKSRGKVPRCRPRRTLVGRIHRYLGKLRRRQTSPGRLAGGIFWLTQKRFCESYLALIEIKRS